MNVPTKLELAKDFIELSIRLDPKKQFILPDKNKIDFKQKIIYLALLELKQSNMIKFGLSDKGEIIAKFCN